MKRILALGCSIALAGCGNGGNNEQPSGGEGTGIAVEDVKVGVIHIGDPATGSGYSYTHDQGIVAMQETLGLSDEQIVRKNNIDDADTTAIENAMNECIEEGCNIIFATSWGYMDTCEALAAEYPNVFFSHATGYKSNGTNFNNYFGRIYQARYLAGLAAGLKSLETGNNNVGYVSAYDTEYAETCSGINGFTLGVQAVNPEATVYVKELGTWTDEVNEYAFAEELINSYGCGVIAQHCDSAQPQLAAEKAGVFGCGYNSDMTADAPKAHLTAAMWNWDVYYKTAIETAMSCESAGQFVTAMGGPAYYGGLNEGMVDVSPLSENCAAGTQDAIDQVKALIATGEWDVFSGVKLNVTVTDGKATVEKVDAPLMTNDGTEIMAAGGPSVEDSVITGSMNYLVEGVKNA